MTPAIPILFADIDGVLNCHDFDAEAVSNPIHREKVLRINRVLKATGARLVLSSAWRYILHRGEMNLAGLDWLLRSHGLLSGALVGITRADTMAPRVYNGVPGTWPVENERGQQIRDWLAVSVGLIGFEARPFAVVDDLDLGISAAGLPFVQTVGIEGLTDADAERLIELLTPSPSEA